MCGRYSYILEAAATESRLNERYPAADITWDPESREQYGGGSYNIAPNTENPVVKRESPEEIELKQWGLVPHWADDPKEWGVINARQETVHEESHRNRYLRPKQPGVIEREPEDTSTGLTDMV